MNEVCDVFKGKRRLIYFHGLFSRMQISGGIIFTNDLNHITHCRLGIPLRFYKTVQYS